MSRLLIYISWQCGWGANQTNNIIESNYIDANTCIVRYRARVNKHVFPENEWVTLKYDILF